MAKYYVTGGTQRKKVKDYIEWFSYGEASVFMFDDQDMSVTKCASYITPDEIRHGVAVFEAIVKSAETGEKVRPG